MFIPNQHLLTAPVITEGRVSGKRSPAPQLPNDSGALMAAFLLCRLIILMIILGFGVFFFFSFSFPGSRTERGCEVEQLAGLWVPAGTVQLCSPTANCTALLPGPVPSARKERASRFFFTLGNTHIVSIIQAINAN